MDYSRHPDVLNFRASQAEMQKWYSYMDEDMDTIYPDRRMASQQPVDRVSAMKHVGQASLVVAQVAQEAVVRLN